MTETDVAWTLVAILGAGFVAVIVLFLGTIVQVVIRLRGQIDEVRYFLRYRFGVDTRDDDDCNAKSSSDRRDGK